MFRIPRHLSARLPTPRGHSVSRRSAATLQYVKWAHHVRYDGTYWHRDPLTFRPQVVVPTELISGCADHGGPRSAANERERIADEGECDRDRPANARDEAADQRRAASEQEEATAARPEPGQCRDRPGLGRS